MEQNRYKEYKESIEDVGEYPEELNHSQARLMKRIRRRKRQIFLRSIGSLVGVFFLFTIIVNTPTALAEAIFDIPVIGDLAEYVSFDKGLQNAIDNEYVQEVNLTEVSNGYTLGLPYVIADDKRLVLFFQLPKDMVKQDNMRYWVELKYIDNPSIGFYNESYCNQSDFMDEKQQPGTDDLYAISIRTSDGVIPKDLEIHVSLRATKTSNKTEVKSSQNEDSISKDDIINPFDPPTLEAENEYVFGSYLFKLNLNAFREPKTIVLNKDIQIKDQTLRINTITEYPTGVEVKVTMPDSNTAVINGLDLKAIDSNGDEWNKIDGVFPLFTNENHTLTCYLEDNYFDSAPLESLEITGLRLFNKSEETLTVDLLKGTLSPESSDLHLKSVEKDGSNANITFESETVEENYAYYADIFKYEYTDMSGKIYQLKSLAASQQDNKTQYYIPVIWPKDNKVVLTRTNSPLIELKKPVKINLPK